MEFKNKQEWLEKVAQLCQGVVSVRKKNNGVKKDAIMKETGSGYQIYVSIPDEWFEYGMVPEQVVKLILRSEKEERERETLIESLNEWEKVKGKIRLIFLDGERNPSLIRRKDYDFQGLIIVPVILQEKGKGMYKVNVTEGLMQKWGVDAETIFRVAEENMDFQIRDLFDFTAGMIAERIGAPKEMVIDSLKSGKEDIPPIYIISSPDGYYGAASVIKAKKELWKIFPKGYVLVPSSIHEMLAFDLSVLESGMDLREIVEMINNDEEIIQPEDVLSYDIFIFRPN